MRHAPIDGLILALVAALLAACVGIDVNGPGDGSLPGCNGTALFTVSPIALNDVVGWVPLGNLNPPAHTLPTNHQYLYHTNPDGGVPHSVLVVSPAAIVVTSARRTTYSSDNHSDYSMTFGVCREVSGGFAHIATLDSNFAAQLGPFNQHCGSYSPEPGLTVTTCETSQLAIALTAGAAIGTSGGTAGLYGFDFSLWDTRIPEHSFANPSRWEHATSGTDDYHVVAASDYFAEPLRTQISAKLGNGNGSVHRTQPPLGGTIALDVPGTAQGYWFKASEPRYPESPHLAFVPDNVNPATMVLSVGVSQTGLSSGVYGYVPTASGVTNRPPASITVDGQLRCVEFFGSRIVLLQLVDATTLRLEARSSSPSCASQTPWTFTAAAVEYHR